MTINSILDNLKYDVTSEQESDMNLTERSALLDMLEEDISKKTLEDEPRPFCIIKQEKEKGKKCSRFPILMFLLKCTRMALALPIWLIYYVAKTIRFLVSGKKEDKDLSMSARFNFVLFVGVITFYIVSLIAIFLFFIKSVLFFHPESGMNERGAVMVTQSCGREHYMYLFNTADSWANTGIKVLKGDQIVVTASGSFNSDIESMDLCAKNNSLPGYPRYIVNNNHNALRNSDRTRRFWMYHNKKDARFGSLLMQIKEDHDSLSYNSDENNIQQLNFSNAWPSRQTVKQSGVLNFAVNDIYLTPKVLNAFGLASLNNLKQNDVEKMKEKGDSIRALWYYDNVGEVYLNITVIRDRIPQNIPMFGFVVKIYRWLEQVFITEYVSPNIIVIWFSNIGLRNIFLLRVIQLLIFILIIILLLYVDYKKGALIIDYVSKNISRLKKNW